MKTIEKIWKMISDSGFRYVKLGEETNLLNRVPSDVYLKKVYKIYTGRELNIDNPKSICEKIQWLKLNDHNDDYTKMVDKHEVKKYVASIIGEEHIVPEYGVWDRFEDIDFDALPNQFILKCTHDSGTFVICKDKNSFDKKVAKKKLEKSLKRNYYYASREWVYKNIKPRIIAEKYMDSLGKLESVEYKVSCFGGKVGFITICQGIAHSLYENRTNDHFTTDFEQLHWYVNYKSSGKEIEKPAFWDELIEYSEKLSKNIPYVRCDFYVHEGIVYFGELTFYTWSGFMNFNPSEWDIKLGEMIELPVNKTTG